MRRVTTGESLRAGAVLLSPEGAFVVLETLLPGDVWGVDLLEDAEGFPAANGSPGCYGLALPSDILKGFKPVPRTNRPR